MIERAARTGTRFTFLFAFMLTVPLLLSGCGPKLVRGEAPLVQVNSWSIDGSELSMSLRIRNVNDEEMLLAALDFTVMLDEAELVSFSGSKDVEVSANGFESFALQMTASDTGTAMLKRLQDGEIKSLPYEFSGTVQTQSGKAHDFNREGHIYTVPGRPGQFR